RLAQAIAADVRGLGLDVCVLLRRAGLVVHHHRGGSSPTQVLAALRHVLDGILHGAKPPLLCAKMYPPVSCSSSCLMYILDSQSKKKRSSRFRKQLTEQGFDAGVVTIQFHLAQHHDEVPSVSTIWRVLNAAEAASNGATNKV